MKYFKNSNCIFHFLQTANQFHYENRSISNARLIYFEEITMTCTMIIRLVDHTMGNLYGTHITNNLDGHQSVSLHRYSY